MDTKSKKSVTERFTTEFEQAERTTVNTQHDGSRYHVQNSEKGETTVYSYVKVSIRDSFDFRDTKYLLYFFLCFAC